MIESGYDAGMTDSSRSTMARVIGAIIGGGGAYAVMRLTDAWGLEHRIVIAIAAGMALAGFMLGGAVWRAVIELA